MEKSIVCKTCKRLLKENDCIFEYEPRWICYVIVEVVKLEEIGRCWLKNRGKWK